MTSGSFELQKGMDVYSSDGQKIGTVGETFSGVPAAGSSSGTAFSDTGASTPRGPAPLDTTGGTPGGGADDASTTGGTGVAFQGGEGYGVSNTGTTTTGFAGGTRAGLGGAADIGPSDTGGGVMLTPSETKYFEVHHGGVLGIGGNRYYVPFSAVDAVAPGDSVTLACTQEECVSQFSDKPAPLSEEASTS